MRFRVVTFKNCPWMVISTLSNLYICNNFFFQNIVFSFSQLFIFQDLLGCTFSEYELSVITQSRNSWNWSTLLSKRKTPSYKWEHITVPWHKVVLIDVRKISVVLSHSLSCCMYDKKKVCLRVTSVTPLEFHYYLR